MTQFKIFTILCVFFVLPVKAQVPTENALGLRVGDNDGLTFELSYQRYLSQEQSHRLEFGVGWKDSNDLEYVKLIGLYEYVSKLSGDYRWYIGAGGGLTNFETITSKGNSPLVAGIIGIEYSEANLPLLFSLDFRPDYAFDDDYSDTIDFDIALSIRFQF